MSLGTEVIAVEPDPAMLAELRRTLPTVRAAFLASRSEMANGELTLPMLTGVLRVRRR